MNWDEYQILALAAVLDQRETYLFRKVCRDYSSRFCTPLHEVYKLPFSFVLTHWMESNIEKLSKSDLQSLAQDIVGIDDSEEALIQDQIKKWEDDFFLKKKNKVKQPYSSQLPEIEEKTLDFSDLDNES